MKTTGKTFQLFCVVCTAIWLMAGNVYGEMLFKDRRIYLRNDDNRNFKIGVTGTTAGYNFIALIENAKQESISLGDMGYWELVADPPSALRNYDLQINIKNDYAGKFQIEFEYDSERQNIRYRVMEGAIQVKLDNREYYPTLIIKHILSAALDVDGRTVPSKSKQFIFYDFNSYDSDLRKHYGSVKRLIKNPNFVHYFYYYESANYNSYYFKTYQSHDQLDTNKMGLSLEDGTLEYYHKILDNLKSLHGVDFADQIIIISRFGKKYSKALKKYAAEAGLSKAMVITLWSYDDIQTD